MYGSITHGDVVLCLTLYSTQAPLDFFEMQDFWKYYEKMEHLLLGSKCSMFHNFFKTSEM